MVRSTIYSSILQRKKKGSKSFAVLIDPDNFDRDGIMKLVDQAKNSGIDYFFVGGSLMTDDNLHDTIVMVKENCDIPVLLFPGSNLHIDATADGILFLSLISGRNADLLIGQHTIAAPILKKSRLEVIPTGYMLVDGGRQTTVSYISNTTPIPANKPDIAACTAMAGEMLGLKLIYLDAGSGADQPVSAKMINMVSRHIDVPLIVGGGIKNSDMALDAFHAGADIVVIGNAIEDRPGLTAEVASMVRSLNSDLH